RGRCGGIVVRYHLSRLHGRSRGNCTWPVHSRVVPPPRPDELLRHLEGVIDPELGANIVELGMAQKATIDEDGLVTVRIALTTAGCPLRAQIQKDVKARLESLPGVSRVRLDWTELNQEQKA